MKKKKLYQILLKRLRQVVKITYNSIELFLTGVFAVLFVLCCITVILRYVFNTSIYGGEEITNYLFIYLTALGAPLLIYKNEHIFVNFFTKVPEALRKSIFFFRYIIVIVFHAILLNQSIQWIEQVGGFPTPLLHIEQRWFEYAIPIGMVMGILFSFSRLLALFITDNSWEV